MISTLGSPFVSSALISFAIAMFAMITRSNPPPDAYGNIPQSSETNTAYFLKLFVISFVCVYFGTMFLTVSPVPEINTGEPDF